MPLFFETSSSKSGPQPSFFSAFRTPNRALASGALFVDRFSRKRPKHRPSLGDPGSHHTAPVKTQWYAHLHGFTGKFTCSRTVTVIYCFPLLLLPLWLTWLQAWPRTFVRNEVCELNFLWFWKLMEHHGIWHTKIMEYIYILYYIDIYNIAIYGSDINSYIYILLNPITRGAVMNII